MTQCKGNESDKPDYDRQPHDASDLGDKCDDAPGTVHTHSSVRNQTTGSSNDERNDQMRRPIKKGLSKAQGTRVGVPGCDGDQGGGANPEENEAAALEAAKAISTGSGCVSHIPCKGPPNTGVKRQSARCAKCARGATFPAIVAPRGRFVRFNALFCRIPVGIQFPASANARITRTLIKKIRPHRTAQ